MQKVEDSLDDWETTYHTEQGQLFGVAYKKGKTFDRPLEQEGPHSSLNRNGRYLLPFNKHINGRFLTTYTQSTRMLLDQRELFHFRDGDIVVGSFPRSGTTWFEQIVLLMLSKGDASQLNTATKNIYDPTNPESKGKLCIELLFHGKEKEEDVGKPWGSHVGQAVIITPEQVEEMKDRRVFKTHLHPFILPGFGEHSDLAMSRLPDFKSFGKDVRFIYAIRDPKDVVISLYKVHLCDMLTKHKMPFTAYVKLFLKGDALAGGYWPDVVGQYIKLSKLYPRNFMIMTYEHNSEHPMHSIKEMADFLDLELSSDERDRCLEFSSFKKMKEMSANASAPHVHQGKVGGWKDIMSKEMVQAFNEMVSHSDLGEYGKKYVFPIEEL